MMMMGLGLCWQDLYGDPHHRPPPSAAGDTAQARGLSRGRWLEGGGVTWTHDGGYDYDVWNI
jgi:hypothetical protein